MILCCRWRPYI